MAVFAGIDSVELFSAFPWGRRGGGGGVGSSCLGWPGASSMTQHRPRVFIKVGGGGEQEQERKGGTEAVELVTPPGHNQQLI